MRVVALSFALLAGQPFQSSVQSLPAPLQTELRHGFWHSGCPVPLSRLRVLTVAHWGFDRRVHTGQLVVNRDAAAPLTRVFRRLYELRFPIRRMSLVDAYARRLPRPRDPENTAAFSCRNAVAS